MKKVITFAIALTFIFGAFGVASTAQARSGSYMICVNNAEYGDCLGDAWLERAERNYWNEWKGGVPGPYPEAPVFDEEVEQKYVELIQVLTELLELLQAKA